MKKEVLILGNGNIGSAVARFLVTDYNVTVADQRLPVRRNNKFINLLITQDCLDPSFQETWKKFDLVVNCLPSKLTNKVIQGCIERKVPLADVSYVKELPGEKIHNQAADANIPMIFDCGIAPGITNLLVGHVIERFEKIENGLIELGGFAADEKVPYGYSLTWNSKDLEEEYTRPATYIEEGVVLQKPALSELEVKNFPGNLKLESFLTDGLRSLTQQTDKIFNLKEKTLRWPGHIEALEPILKSGNLVKELHACIHTPDILIGVLTLDDISYELEVHHDDDMLYTDWNIPALSAMQNATAGACAAFARFVLENYIEPGVWYPEDLAQENPLYFDFIIKEFTKNKNIHLTEIKKKRL